jgi:FixJ family two-component response regulator
MATIAVIDDDQEIRIVLSEMLRTAGHRVLTYSDGEPFLETRDLQQIDLIITDLVMKTSGQHVVRELAKAGHVLPIIVTAGHIPNSTACYLLASGVHQILPKPFSMAALLSHVEKWLSIAPKHKIEAQHLASD